MVYLAAIFEFAMLTVQNFLLSYGINVYMSDKLRKLASIQYLVIRPV